jgi:1-aminocyclopropane-1-carboxylate deaminase/D-cysteine desulfhydrase-like pyridoxal-dependent ACC family enzyme
MAVNFPPSLKFTHPNTPIYPLKRFAEPFTGKNIWIKRDDYTGIELSGNKVRKLDYLLSEAMWNKASHIITCGGFCPVFILFMSPVKNIRKLIVVWRIMQKASLS